MLIGIVIAFQNIFCDVVPDLCKEYWEMSCDGLSGILDI